MADYSPELFAKWLNESFKNSRYKSFSEMADLIGLSRATISSYASARPQTLSNKASRPKRENVIKLAMLLDQDVDEALLLSGHAPANSSSLKKPESVGEFVALLQSVGLDMQFNATFDNFTPDDFQDLMEDIKEKILGKEQRKKLEELQGK